MLVVDESFCFEFNFASIIFAGGKWETYCKLKNRTIESHNKNDGKKLTSESHKKCDGKLKRRGK